MCQVIADQSVWAVCGKQGAVVNLSQNKKQTIVVEVMPLIGGHLALPSIRLSKVFVAYYLQSNIDICPSIYQLRTPMVEGQPDWIHSPWVRCTTWAGPSRSTCCHPTIISSRRCCQYHRVISSDRMLTVIKLCIY